MKEDQVGIFRAEGRGNQGLGEYHRNLCLCQMTELCQENKTGKIRF